MNNSIKVTPEIIRSRVEQIRADSPWMEEYEIEAIICTELNIDPTATPDLYVVLEAALRGSRPDGSSSGSTTASAITEDVTGKFAAYEPVNKGASQRKDIATRALYTLTENAAANERSSAVLEKARVSISRNIKQEVTQVSFTLILFMALCLVISFLVVVVYAVFSYSSMTGLRLSDIDAFVTNPQVMAILQAGMMLLCLAVPFVVYVLTHKLPVQEMIPVHKLRQGEFMPMFLVGLGVLTLDGCLVNYVNSLTGLGSAAASSLTSVRGAFYSFDAISLGSSPFDIVLTVVCLGVVPALVETFVFNGVILQVFRRRGGDNFALLLSSILFALTTTDFVEMLGAFVSCLLLGYLVIYSGSLIPATSARLAERILFVVITQLGFGLDSDVNMIHYIDCLLTIVILLAAVLAARTMLIRFPEMFVLKKSDPCLTLAEKMKMSFLRPPVLVLIIICVLLSAIQLISLDRLPTIAESMMNG